MLKINSQSKNWCFTDNQLTNLKAVYEKYKADIRYMCWGLEKGKKTKRKHFQGWIQFFKKKRLNRVKNILGKTLHLEIMRGSEFDNEKYCRKEGGDFFEFGKFISQGHRSDLNHVKNKILKGASIQEIQEEDFEIYCRYRNGIKDLHATVTERNAKEFRHVKVELICGPTGCGKTRYAMKNATYKINGSGLNWWDGYRGDKSICIDEYNNDVGITKMLNLLDGYVQRLPIKGSFTYANWDTVYITTNLTPERLHSCAKQAHRDALFRRITKVTNFWEKCAEVTQG